MKSFTVFVVLLASLRCTSGQGGISTSHFCTGISSVGTLQEVIYADAAKQSSCIKFIGEDDGQVWSLDDSPALDILENQQVVIDCGGKYFDYHSSRGQLTMGQGSTLHYHNCSLVNYDFPETNRVYGTLHMISSSTIGMQTCTRQANASFETGKLVDNANGTAVYVFLLAFDSLSGPQIRFEFTDSTMYCKSMEAAVPDAIVAAEQFGPEVRMYSDAASTDADAPVAPGVVEAGGDGGSDSKLWAFGVVAGVAIVVLCLASYLLWYVRRKLGSKGGVAGEADGARYLAKHYGTSRNEVVSTSQMGPTSGSIDGRRYMPPNQ